MKLLISAAETSSDIHGSQLLQALRKIVPDVQAFGMGGPHLQRAGLDCRVDASELLAMGFSEIFARLPRILAARRSLVALAETRKPDLAIVIDYPDFHFALARKLKKLGVPVIYFIPPKVWAWRKYRVRTLRRFFTKILSILPFEIDFYRRENLNVTYVGNPLVDELPLALTRTDARAQLGLKDSQPVLLLMPGSRPAEVKRHLPLMMHATRELAAKLREELTVLIPFPETQKDQRVLEELRATQVPGVKLRVLSTRGKEGVSASALAMKAADYGIIKSGTSTLEAALLDCAHFIIYRASWLSELIFHFLVRYRGPVGLSNLVFTGLSDQKPELVPELLAAEANMDSVSQELVSLATDEGYRTRQRQGFAEIRRKVVGEQGIEKRSPSDNAARAVWETWRALPGVNRG